MQQPPRSLVALLALLSLFAVAAFGCSDKSSSVVSSGSTSTSLPEREDSSTRDAERTADDPDVLVSGIVDDLNEYWSGIDDELGFGYTPLVADRISTGGDGVLCDGEEIPPEDVEENAFVDAACAEGIVVAYDPGYVAVSVERAESTMAHEWGHVIQAQARELDLALDPEGLPIDGELQADCFAGAWAADYATANPAALRRNVAETGDLDDIPIDDPDAHGFADERTAAYDIGYDGGAKACVDQIVDALP